MTQDQLRAVPESPLKRARRAVERELKALPNNPVETRWLHNNPLVWLRALNQALRDVDQTVNDELRILGALKPAHGTTPSAMYLTAKVAHDKRAHEYSAHRTRIGSEIENVKMLLGEEPVVGYLAAGDMCSLMLELLEKVTAGDLAAAKAQLLWWADRFADQDLYGTKAALTAELEGAA